MARKTRSRRSYLAELVAVAVAFGAIYLFLMNGVPTAFGQWLGHLLGAP
jgi:hypothetical protein